MTWPAPDLRIDYQNATVSADTHPDAHNETNVTLNDSYRPEIIRLGGVLDALQVNFIPGPANATVTATAAGDVALRDSTALRRPQLQIADGTEYGKIYSIAQPTYQRSGATDLIGTSGKIITNGTVTISPLARDAWVRIDVSADFSAGGAAECEMWVDQQIGGAAYVPLPDFAKATYRGAGGSDVRVCSFGHGIADIPAGSTVRFRLNSKALTGTCTSNPETSMILTIGI